MTLPAVLKDDPMLEKIRKTLKEFKENIMINARLKLKQWEVKKNGKHNIKNKD